MRQTNHLFRSLTIPWSHPESGDFSENSSIQTLLLQLWAEIPSIRKVAIKKLGESGDPSVIEEIMRAALDPDAEVASAARAVLHTFNTVDALPYLLRGTEHPDPAIRTLAISVLGSFSTQKVIPVLSRAAKHLAKEVRVEATLTLARIPDPSVLQIIWNQLYDTQDEVRLAALRALGNLDPAPSLPAFIAAAQDANWELRREAALALAKIPAPESERALLSLLDDPNPMVVKTAIHSLGQLEARVAGWLTRFLSHEDPDIRVAALRAIATSGEQRVAPLLAGLMLHDPVQSVREAAKLALEQVSRL